MLRAAIVGLGRIGSRFDEEPGRRVPWSHAGAYLALPDTARIVAAVEVATGSIEAFRRRCPDVPVVASVRDLPDGVDAVSICTPAETHRAVLDEVLEIPGLRVVWCEKPLAMSRGDGAAMVERCRARGVTLAVSHMRRWHPLWRRVVELTPSLGTLRCVRVTMPNRLWAIGSHALDLLLMLGGKVREARVLDVPALFEEGEPARPALFALESGAYGILEVSGMKANLLVEAELIGDRGRLRVNEQRGEVAIATFGTSANYAGYHELGDELVERLGSLAEISPFVEIVRELAVLAAEPARKPACSGEDALAVQDLLDALAASPNGRIGI